MSKEKSIRQNIFMSMLLTGSDMIFPIITYSYVARVITPTGTGKIAFVNSILNYFLYIAMLGIPTYGLRECAKVRDNKEKFSHLVQELLMINLISTLIAYIFLIGAILFIQKLYSYKEIFLVMSCYLFLSTIGLEWVYRSLEEYTYITLRSLVLKVLAVILTFVFIRDKKDYIWYGALSIFSVSAGYIFNFVNIHKYVSFKKVGKYDLKKHLKPITILFSTSIILTIYANFDVTMIGFISTEEEVGLYSAALKIKNILLSVSTAITSVLIPRIAYYIQKKDEKTVEELWLNSLRLSMLLALPVAIYVFLYAENVLCFVCGSTYVEATNTLRILMICIIPLIFTNLFGNQMLILLGNEQRFSQSVFVGMWINLFLNFLMIPSLGALGAAVGTLITECWNVYWMGGSVKKYKKNLMGKLNLRKYVIPLILSTVCSILVSRFVYRMNIILQLTITALIFFGIYFTIELLLKEPLINEQVKKIVNKYLKK